MHHAFEVDEILRLIASCIEYEDREDAICFACCCKSFSAPALDVIWGRYQRRFTPLLQTLPPSVWTIVDEVFDFVRQPSEEEWARLSVYARRVHYFMDPNPDFPSEAALKLLNTRFSGRCMLPKLQDIRWISASPKHIEPTLRLIVSPALTNFRLALRNYGPISASQLVPALEALAPAYNSLVEIRICHSTIHDPRTIHAASTLLLKCNPDKLLYFHVDSALSVEAFIHATQLPNLEAFTFRAHTTELGIPLPTSTFPSLRSLDVITVNTDSPLLQAITHIQSTTFAGLRLEFPAATVGTFLPATLATLRPRGLHQTLTRLSITPEGDFNLDGAALRPLLFLNQLTMLEVWLHCSQGQCPYKLSDENLEALVKAMPKLKSLCLGSIPCSHPANTTLKSLVSIAKYCKYLDELVIHTNVEAIIAGVPQYDNWGEDRTLEALNPTLVGCPLRHIIFGPCFIPGEQRGAVTFALTLLRLFPSLVRATAFQPTPETDPQWELVDDVIVSHTRARVNIMDAAADTGVN